MRSFCDILTPERIEKCTKARLAMRAEHLKKAEEILGQEAADALGDLLGLYDEKLYIWMAGLWEPQIGGFYHNESGRKTENMLPDIESTGQVLYFLVRSGLTNGKQRNDPDAFPTDFKEAISRFTLSLLDPEDGYFYHPQWGKNISTSRRGRDLAWSNEIIEDFGITPPYPTALERLTAESDDKKTLLPEHLTDINKLKDYLNALEIGTRSYYCGNLLQAQGIQIVAAGQEYVDTVLGWIEENQRDDNGLWQPEVNYDAVNGLMKIGLLYTTCKRPIPRVDQALESTIKAALSDEPTKFVCEFYNPLITINNLLNSMLSLGRAEDEQRMRETIRKAAPELIRKTKEKIAGYKVEENGAFTYNLNRRTSGVSQGMHVELPGLSNGGVNSTCICAGGTLRGLFTTLGIDMIPLYCKEDSELFFELIKNAKVHPKTEPYPGNDVFYAGKSYCACEMKK